MNSGIRSSSINSGTKICSTTTGRSKLKLTRQMQACYWTLWALRGCVRIVFTSLWLLIKQNTCAWVHSAIKTHRKLVMWKAVEKQGRGIEPKIIFTSYFNSNLTYSLPEHGKSCLLLNAWLSKYIANIPGPSSHWLQPTVAARLTPFCV